MEELRDSVLKVQNKYKNPRGQHFVSNQELYEVLSRDSVHKALHDKDISNSCKLEVYHIDHAVDAIISGAHRIFAILVYIRNTKCIRHFIEGDKYKGSGLDHGLPFDKENLRTILPTELIADEFYERQWHFSAPIFSDSVFSRALPPETILPFTNEQRLGEGGFGDVYSINIEPSHQRYCDNSVQHWEVS